MKTIIKFISIFLLPLLFVFSCGADDSGMDIDPPSDSINKIMPLGASRVEGNRPNYESFRYELWKDLNDNNWTFDFVGTQKDEADYPSYSGANFDIDHEGRGGWRSDQILAGINDWLDETGSPDIVLFSSPGGNDALQGWPYEQAVDNINAIIDALQANNPNVTIVLEQMAPGHSDIMNESLSSYLSQMRQEITTMVSSHTTSTSKVIAVDMSTGFSDQMLADDVHYNETGAAFIAERYYNVLKDILE